MKIEEQLAENYLKKLNLQDLIFKPDGNIPPDFSLDNNIAVEVLNLARNAEGWVLDEFIKNFNIGIEEITDKIKGFKKNYSSWWLILVDQVVHKFTRSEKEKIKSMFRMNEFWNRVIVIDLKSGKSILEIAKIFEI